MKEYIDIVQEILIFGQKKRSRAGNTLSCFGLEFEYQGKEFPLLTTKRMHFQSVVAELIWFLSGENHIRNLRKHTGIWNPWANEDGDLDSCYGYFWRRFPSIASGMPFLGKTEIEKVVASYLETISAENFDQIKKVVEELREHPDSRRLLVSAVEPANFWASRLPACHHAFCFYHLDGELSLHVSMRSTDVAIGLPFNVASYYLLLCLICQEVNMVPGKLKISMTDCHIYEEHLPAMRKQVKREGFDLPILEMPDKSIFELTYEDIPSFNVVGYQSHEPIKYKVLV